MFEDKRSKKLVLVAHCILNQNSISDGTADHPGAIKEIINLLLQSDIGIIQMPCPELLCLGLDRGNINGAEQEVVVENTRIRKLMDQPSAKQKLNLLVKLIVYQIEEYLLQGFKIFCIVGINRSPSCGVDTTSKNNKEVEGKGVFIEALVKELEIRGVFIDLIGIRASDIKQAKIEIEDQLNNS